MSLFSHSPRALWFRGVVLVAWLVLSSLLVQRELFVTAVIPGEQRILGQAEREEYQGGYFRDQKIGYVM